MQILQLQQRKLKLQKGRSETLRKYNKEKRNEEGKKELDDDNDKIKINTE